MPLVRRARHAKLPNWIITHIGHQGDHSGSLDRKEIRNLSKTSSKRRITISMRYKPSRPHGSPMRSSSEV